MEYKEFVTWVAEKLPPYLEKELGNCRVQPIHTGKLQGASYDGIQLIREKSSKGTIGMALNLLSFYEQKEEMEEDALLKEIAAIFSELKFYDESMLEKTLQFDPWKDPMRMEAVAVKGNEEILESLVYRKVEDLAIVIRREVSVPGPENGSMLLTRGFLKNSGVSEESVWSAMDQRAEEDHPVVFWNFGKDFRKMGLMIPEEMEKNGLGFEMYILTTNESSPTAACLFFPGVMEDVARKIGGSFYALPSSIYEWVILPESIHYVPKDMALMVKEINEGVVKEKERLSNSVYLYDADEKQFRKIAG